MSDLSELLAAAIKAGIPIVVDNRHVTITVMGDVHIGESQRPIVTSAMPLWQIATLRDTTDEWQTLYNNCGDDWTP